MNLSGRRLLLFALFLFALAVRLFCVHTSIGLGRLSPRDHAEFANVAQGLLERGVFACPWEIDQADPAPSALMPPVYVGVVALAYMLLGVKTWAAHVALQTVNAMALAAVVPVTFHLARRLWGETAAWLAALLVTVNPALAGFAYLIWETSFFVLGATVTVWMSCVLGERRRRGTVWLAFGAWLGVLALLNPALTLTYPLLVLWPLVRQHWGRVKPIAGRVALTVVGWAVTVAPWCVRYYYHHGEVVYVRSGLMQELWFGVCPEVDRQADAFFGAVFPMLNEDAKRYAVSLGEREYIAESGRRAISAIEADPGRYLRLTMLRVADYAAGTIYSHMPPGKSGWPKSAARAAGTAFLTAELVAFLMLLILGARIDRHARWLLGMVLIYAPVYIFTHVMVRYRSPMEPIVAAVLAAMLCDLYARRRDARRTASTVVNG